MIPYRCLASIKTFVDFHQRRAISFVITQFEIIYEKKHHSENRYQNNQRDLSNLQSTLCQYRFHFHRVGYPILPSLQNLLYQEQGEMADNKFLVDYAKMGTSKCKKCKQGIEKKSPRIAKLVPNPFSDEGGDMKQYFHIGCIFESFVRARATTKKIEDPSDLEGFENMEEEEKKTIRKHIDQLASKIANKTPSKKKNTVQAVLSPGGKVVSPTKALAASRPSSSTTNGRVINVIACLFYYYSTYLLLQKSNILLS